MSHIKFKFLVLKLTHAEKVTLNKINNRAFTKRLQAVITAQDVTQLNNIKNRGTNKLQVTNQYSVTYRIHFF